MWARRVLAGALAGARTIDGRFLGWAARLSVVSLVVFGVLNAIVPTPFFARPIAPEPFAIFVWLASAPLMGVVAATYLAPAQPVGAAPAPVPLSELGSARGGTRLGWLGGFAAFLAIGCPVCNKVALVLLGTSGALSVYAPLQPLIGAISISLLLVTIALRFQLRGRALACPT